MCSGYTRNDVTDFNHTDMQEQMGFKVRTMIEDQHLRIFICLIYFLNSFKFTDLVMSSPCILSFLNWDLVHKVCQCCSVFITFSPPVGCALAGLVLMVLVAYLVGEQQHYKLKKYVFTSITFSGRRKSRARGYQSV